MRKSKPTWKSAGKVIRRKLRDPVKASKVLHVFRDSMKLTPAQAIRLFNVMYAREQKIARERKAHEKAE